MSAYVVDKQHIDVLVGLAIAGPSRAPQYPGDGFYGPRWFASEPQDDWTLEDYQRESHCAKLENADEIGAMLLGECIASVTYRYHDEPVEDLPGNVAQLATWAEMGPEAYRYKRVPCKVSAVEGLSAIACFDYQSCEHPGWKSSEAFRFCEALKDSLIGQLDGYRDAPWSWDERTLAEKRGAVVR